MSTNFEFPVYLHEFEEIFEDDFWSRCSKGFKGYEMQLLYGIGDSIKEELDFDHEGHVVKYNHTFLRYGKCERGLQRVLFPILSKDYLTFLREHNSLNADELEACWYLFKTDFDSVGDRLIEVYNLDRLEDKE